MDRTKTSVTGWGLALLSSAVLAQQAPPAEIGKREFENNCAVCHGMAGKGDGPYAEWLVKGPSDLTMLSQRNGGVFPLTRVYEVISGEGQGHGPRDMPVWGREYRIQAAEYYMEMPYDERAFVRARILALTEYLNRLQAR